MKTKILATTLLHSKEEDRSKWKGWGAHKTHDFLVPVTKPEGPLTLDELLPV